MAAAPETLAELVAQLGDALAEERRALLGGRPQEIAAAAQKKAALAERIEAATAGPGTPQPSAETVAALARTNQENGIICDAMLRHLTDAIDRLRQIDLHRSYGADGSEQPHSAQHVLGAA